MLSKTINLVLLMAIITSLFLMMKNHFGLEELRAINKESKEFILNHLYKQTKKANKRPNTYVVRSNYLSNQNSFLELDKKSRDRDIKMLIKYQLLKPLDSIIENDPLAENWQINKAKIQSIFIKTAETDDSIKQHLKEYDLEYIFQKNTISFYNWKRIIQLKLELKSLMNNRIGGFYLCFEYGYNFIGIPSKKVVKIGDTVFIDWINYYGGHYFINETYKVKSNYDKFHILETIYDPCGNGRTETILLEEYQIPFSAIEKDKKWRSVFYFRNDKLEQDSVVLERELEF